MIGWGSFPDGCWVMLGAGCRRVLAQTGAGQFVPARRPIIRHPTHLSRPAPPHLDLSSLQEERQRCARTLAEVERRFPKGVPLLDPEEDMKVAVGLFSRFFNLEFVFVSLFLLLDPEEGMKVAVGCCVISIQFVQLYVQQLGLRRASVLLSVLFPRLVLPRRLAPP